MPKLLKLHELRQMAVAPSISYRDIEGDLELSLVRCAQSTDKVVAKLAQEILIRAHDRAILRWTKRLTGGRRDHDLALADLKTEAQMGFLRAVAKFRFDHGVKLLTYATWWFRARLERSIADTGHTIRVPVWAASKRPEEKAPEAAAAYRMFSLNRQVSNFDATFDDVAVTHLDLLKSEWASPEAQAMENIDVGASKQAVRDAMAKLPDRYRAVIYGRFFDKRDRTLADIGKDMGISRERVRQLEGLAMAKLRQLLIPQREKVVDALSLQ